jgi:hypothetical protein
MPDRVGHLAPIFHRGWLKRKLHDIQVGSIFENDLILANRMYGRMTPKAIIEAAQVRLGDFFRGGYLPTAATASSLLESFTAKTSMTAYAAKRL